MTNPLYLRKYRVLVVDKNNNALDVSDLRCTFMIEKKALQAVNYADITIYNLTGPTEQAIIKEGQRVIVEAGYQDGAYGVIFDGDIFQPLWDRENVVDYKLTLHCISGDSFLKQNFIAFSKNAGYDYMEIIKDISVRARTPIPLGHITSNLDSNPSPRGKVIFGNAKDHLRNIARGNNAQMFADDGKLHITKITDVPQGQALVLSPQTGLVGTPQQIDYGFSFRCLINPTITIVNPSMMVKIDNSLLRQKKAIIGQIVSMIDQDMVGLVIGITTVGDTRGQEWYQDVVCLTRGGKVPLQLAAADFFPEMIVNQMENPN